MQNFFVQFPTLGSSIMTMLGALLIFILGWIIAGVVGAGVHRLATSANINQRMNTTTGAQYDVARISSRIAFWFVFLMAVAAAMSFLRLDAISTPFGNMINSVLLFLPNLIAAAIIAVIGWVVATVVRKLIVTALNRTTLDEKLATEAGVSPMSENIASIAYWFILLMFLSMVLQKLGLSAMLTPINGMMNDIFAFLPKIFTAGLFFFVGYIVAKILRGIVTNLVASLNIQGVAQKAGISDQLQIANVAGGFVYLIVMVMAIIMGLNALQIEAIVTPATNMLNQIMMAIPQIVGAVAIIGLTYFVVRFVVNIVKGLLENTGVNALPARVGMQDVLGTTRLTDAIGHLIMFFALLFASIAAANHLGFTQVSDLLSKFIEFGAQIVLGAVILAIGFWLANVVANVVKRSQNGSNFLANLVRVLIMGLVLAMGLRAMGIADSIVNLAFGLTLGAVAVAFALAFGLGGREAAARLLKRVQDKAEKEIDDKDNKPTF
ncbi:mechanosensitive ion channel [Acinetobacter sp. c3-l95]|uniref:mechanosensitive ion channel n=1 Tax=Acinetobacter sp. c3-l95 TaxID=3342804 RepID=UPI0035B8ED9B